MMDIKQRPVSIAAAIVLNRNKNRVRWCKATSVKSNFLEIQEGGKLPKGGVETPNRQLAN
jgi:hypothetical protein